MSQALGVARTALLLSAGNNRLGDLILPLACGLMYGPVLSLTVR